MQFCIFSPAECKHSNCSSSSAPCMVSLFNFCSHEYVLISHWGFSLHFLMINMLSIFYGLFFFFFFSWTLWPFLYLQGLKHCNSQAKSGFPLTYICKIVLLEKSHTYLFINGLWHLSFYSSRIE